MTGSDNFVFGTNCGINLGVSSWCVLIGDDIPGEKDQDHQFVIKKGIPTLSYSEMYKFLKYICRRNVEKYGDEKAKLIRLKLSEIKHAYHQKLSAVEFIHTYDGRRKKIRTPFRNITQEPVLLNLLVWHLPVADVPKLVLQYLVGDWCLEHCTSIDCLPVYRDSEQNTYLDIGHTIYHSVEDRPAKVVKNIGQQQEWYRNGKLHRDGDKPAIVHIESGQQMWFQWGVSYRNNDD